MKSFAERLADRVRATGNALCVGLDPRPDAIPSPPIDARGTPTRVLEDEVLRLERYCQQVIDAVADLVPAIKPQIAFFERHGAFGVAAFERLCRSARRRGLLVVVDAKRSDIATTAAAYAQGFLETLPNDDRPLADALTVNPYFGTDGLKPFVDAAYASKSGLFVLVKTSNPTSAEIQDLKTPDDTVYQRVAAILARLEPEKEGAYGLIGAVVGATQKAVIPDIRERLPRSWLLLPGVGAQGATMEDAASAFDRDGLGALVNVSRSVLYPWLSRGEKKAPVAWQDDVRRAVITESTALCRALADRR